ncbi:YnfA family protein [Cryobacterium sp. TMT1-1]|uniref:YnfA family protein n=1 Tax=Cryobacterium lyxosi TaxID=1259228 RepID=UPI00157FA6B9
MAWHKEFTEATGVPIYFAERSSPWQRGANENFNGLAYQYFPQATNLAQTIRESKPWWFAGLGVLALAGYGFVAAFQPDANFGRVLAAYGGIFVAGSLAWEVFIDGFKPTVWDFIGSTICLIGAAIIMAAPAGSAPTE